MNMEDEDGIDGGMDDAKELLEHIEQDWEPILKWVIKAFCIFVILLVLTMGSCTVLTSFDDADQTRANAEYKRASNEVALAQIKAVEDMIKTGETPMDAHCAIYGWTSEREANACADANRLRK